MARYAKGSINVKLIKGNLKKNKQQRTWQKEICRGPSETTRGKRSSKVDTLKNQNV